LTSESQITISDQFITTWSGLFKLKSDWITTINSSYSANWDAERKQGRMKLDTQSFRRGCYWIFQYFTVTEEL